MGYAYRGPTSSPVGSIAPLDRADDGLGPARQPRRCTATGACPLDQVIIGLPAYGLTWATLGPELHAERAPAERLGARPRDPVPGRRRPPLPPERSHATRTRSRARPASTWYDPDAARWFQTYYDTPATLRAKYLLALEAGTAGVGIWTLGYDAGLPGYPALVARCSRGPWSARVTVDPVAAAHRSTCACPPRRIDGPAATNGVRVSNDGLTWSAWMDAALLDPARDGPLDWPLAAGPDGTATV